MYCKAYMDSHLKYNLLIPKQNLQPPCRCKRRTRMVLVTYKSWFLILFQFHMLHCKRYNYPIPPIRHLLES